MTPLVPIALFGWIPVVLLLFATLRPRTAVATAFVVAWCFLPVAGYSILGLPDYTKMTATCYAVLLGTGLFHSGVFAKLRPHWIDLPMVVWCVVPLASSISNGLGVYDGISGVLSQTIVWGFPYLIGRLYFTEVRHLTVIVQTIIIFGIIYIPLCLFEIRMSPQLHYIFYGYYQHQFAQTMRYGGYRPMVFMNHGLQVGMWMGIALVLSVGSWRYGAWRTIRFMGILLPIVAVCAALGTTLILVKSTGAIVLAAVGIAAIVSSHALKTAVPMAAIALSCVLYLGLRATQAWSGEGLVEMAAEVNEDRAASLEFRMYNENILGDKARERPWFGWGGWGRGRIYDEDGNDISITDGLWIIAFGMNGTVGLVSLYSAMLLGPTLLVMRCKPRRWRIEPETAIAAALAVACMLEAADSLPNGMQIPVMTMALGAVTGVAVGARQGITHRRERSSTAPQNGVAAIKVVS